MELKELTELKQIEGAALNTYLAAKSARERAEKRLNKKAPEAKKNSAWLDKILAKATIMK